ncbi:ABC transporter substrate-binding protein [Clostridium septicum]|uniref:ABC transporter substrate-binding protein n=1 Tax=Clostridium septicum TaxID=1504 RepID=UPI00272EA86F|nr:ABC transporter substrate-binding protein [Clostridium septicum]WLF70428.1 ABC transporter substrate-binding protein [Clostridium septicum]
MKKRNRILSLVSTLLFAIMLLVGCGKTEVTMKDREGTEFKVPKKVNTIISTAPSNTEVLVELGLSNKLVAIDKYSADVEGVNQDLPKIDFRNPDAETIIALKPDLIIASGHNKAGDKDPFALIKEAGIPVAYIPSSYSIDGIYGDIEFISKLTGTEKKGNEIINNMKKEVADIKAIGDKITDKKKVYFEIGSGSKLSSFGKDTFLNEMIEIIGAENIFANEKSWISPSPESIIAANPDVILTNMPEVNGVKAVDDIKSRAGWENVKAVKDGAVYGIDKNTSARPSQNVIKALKEMAKAVYPNEYK